MRHGACYAWSSRRFEQNARGIALARRGDMTLARVLLLTVFVGAAGCSGTIDGTDDDVDPAGLVGPDDDNAADFGATNWGENDDDDSIDPNADPSA